MSSGGTVPHQGTNSDALSAKKQAQLAEDVAKSNRGPRGTLGRGTPGKRLKNYWRYARRKDPSLKGSLKHFVHLAAKYMGTEPTAVINAQDAVTWLDRKAHPARKVRQPRIKASDVKTEIKIPRGKGR